MSENHAAVRRFVLGVDLDGVCAQYVPAFHTYCRAQGMAVPDSHHTESWDLTEAGWFATREEYMDAHRQAVAAGLFAWMPEVPGASDALWVLSDLEVHLRVVTHRLHHGDHHVVTADTTRWLQAQRPDGRARIPYRDLVFLGTKHALDSDLHIDDAPHVIEEMQAAGQNVLIFDHPYNRHLAGPRARNWTEVVEYVTARMNEHQTGA